MWPRGEKNVGRGWCSGRRTVSEVRESRERLRAWARTIGRRRTFGHGRRLFKWQGGSVLGFWHSVADCGGRRNRKCLICNKIYEMVQCRIFFPTAAGLPTTKRPILQPLAMPVFWNVRHKFNLFWHNCHWRWPVIGRCTRFQDSHACTKWRANSITFSPILRVPFVRCQAAWHVRSLVGWWGHSASQRTNGCTVLHRWFCPILHRVSWRVWVFLGCMWQPPISWNTPPHMFGRGRHFGLRSLNSLLVDYTSPVCVAANVCGSLRASLFLSKKNYISPSLSALVIMSNLHTYRNPPYLFVMTPNNVSVMTSLLWDKILLLLLYLYK